MCPPSPPQLSSWLQFCWTLLYKTCIFNTAKLEIRLVNTHVLGLNLTNEETIAHLRYIYDKFFVMQLYICFLY